MSCTTIHGYRVETELMSDANDPERGTWVGCWVSKGRHANSLEVLDGEGQFDEGPTISHSALDAIRAWAERQGWEG